MSLFFDGDAAGRKAVHKALRGLLGLEGVELDVVRLPEGSDPCDLLVQEQRAGFDRLVAEATGWFEFLLGGLRQIEPTATSELVGAVEELVETVVCVQHPVGRDALIARMAVELGLDVQALREQAGLALRRAERQAGAGSKAAAGQPAGRGYSARDSRGQRSRAAAGASGAPRASSESGGRPESSPSAAPRVERNPTGVSDVQTELRRARLSRAWRHFTGALLCDNGLIAVHREAARAAVVDRSEALESDSGGEQHRTPESGLLPCPDPRVSRVLHRLIDLYDNSNDPDLVLDGARLAEEFQRPGEFAGSGSEDPSGSDDQACAALAVELEALARLAESPRECVEQALVRLEEFARVERLRGAKRNAVLGSGLERDPRAWSEADHCRLLERYQAELDLRPKEPVPAAGTAPASDLASPAARSTFTPNEFESPAFSSEQGRESVPAEPLAAEPTDHEQAPWAGSSELDSVSAASDPTPDPDDFFHDGADSLTFDLLS